ncbi:N-6 DNA methylase [uncultured Flavobacterium sp.]|mgnify:CR=1 FL=1|uniref:Eco57I restriction-modification methylase domain-containing protein n=1 Tax=uncultured Flavobacterium sp. TaxID=165435 RepID=UPI0030EB9539
MALYQKSVLKKYITLLDKSKVDKAYKKYANHFLNPTIQENIRNSKEEEYQGIFLTDLFVNVLDYTLKPNANFNLVAEYKNQTNSRKADGAILFDNKATGVIELKGTNTKDLESIRKQAFDYKANQKECVYVITSNYEKLRFYINDATEFEEFNLFELTKEQFELLYLCLHKEHIENNIPLKIKEASLLEEEQITKKFYKDYSLFKRELYRDLVKRNTKRIKSNLSKISTDTNEADLDEETKADLLKLEKNVKLNLFKKSQKLIDRFLFVFFAEDRGLLPPNSTLQILNKWEADVDFGDDRPLYDMFKQYFKFLDIGRQGTTNRAEIYAYNGGLFKEDVVLDQLEIDNDLLYNHTKALAAYDFESQVDVNILGHIFENSLNEIESVNAEIEGGDFDKQKSKRKKDGVFYTPKYITKYIVENTIGKLCEEKKNELGFKEEEYFKGRKNRQQATIIKLVEILGTYRDWLLQLTICDPACGSGAFLNQALDFLIKEHNYIDELKAKILGGGLVFSDIENTILENNIYGVDLNEESVEIAKLSLWLRTAQPRRKLNNLNSNIKCGNSLIDSKTVAGDKAFNWQEQFPTVFAKGGFDVIIGNPPWGAKLDDSSNNYLIKNYPLVPTKIKDSYLYFMLLSIKKIKPHKGLLGFIVPNTWLLINNASDFRKYILNFDINQIIDHGDNVFSDAIVESSTLILKNDKTINNKVLTIKQRNGKDIINHVVDKSMWLNDNLHRIVVELKAENYELINKLEAISKPFENSSEIIFGIKPYQVGHGTPEQTREMLNQRIYHSNTKIDDKWFPLVTGTDVNRYNLCFEDEYVNYGKNLMYPSNEIKINSKKILLRRTSHDLRAVLDKDKFYPQNSLFIITSKLSLEYLMCLLNSKLFDFIYKSKCPQVGKVFAEVKPSIIKSLPIIEIGNDFQHNFEKIANIMLFVNVELQEKSTKFTKYLQSQFAIEKLTKKLENWYDLDFGDFIKEINKAIKLTNKERVKNELQPIKELTKLDEMDWMDVFETKKAEAQNLKQQIVVTDKEIDSMVYELYGLTEEEITIVENS